MDYSKIYDNLIQKGVNRELTSPLAGYSERHHILPRCLGGTDVPSNRVRLTPEEHYVAHLLLVKMHPTEYKLLWAVIRMVGGSTNVKRTNKLYGWTRRRFIEYMRQPKSDETRRRMSEYWTKHRREHPVTDEMRQRMRERNVGKKHSEETKKKMSEAHTGKPKSEAHKQKMSEQRKGRKHPPRTAEYIEKQRQNMKRVWADRKRQKGDEQP